ncbi:unnamed protein product [Sphagnum troendelagicum]|uniref:Alanine racemase N-terminal domain-containing protein n=1 Tax=Sphagnum troendelagicum TaxID=128251 RepID=A0ABP0TD47_9BRYO
MCNLMQRVQQACDHAHRPASQVRVVAVSKTKPVSMIQEVYDGGHRHFGENYVQEFLEKAPQLPADIQWHFVGHLQSNKAKVLVANHLDRAVSGVGRQPLRVLVQVNTSGEESKSGVEPSECVHLAKHVKQDCSNLLFSGLMAISMRDYTSTPENLHVISSSGILDLRIWSRLLELTGFG